MGHLTSTRKRAATIAAATVVVGLVASACSGGASDSSDNSAPLDTSKGTINVVTFSVTKAGFDQIGPAFNKTADGKGWGVVGSYGASGEQSRKVKDGVAKADYVNFSLESDVTRLVPDLVDENWNADAYKGVPFGSVVTFVVRKGNPKNIQSWDDLLKPDVEVITPNPLSSGGAKWNVLGGYSAKSDGGKNPQAGIDYVGALVKDHVKVFPTSAREASDAFLQGRGDVLISYENEALFVERDGKPVQHVNPATTFKIENVAAVAKTSPNAAAAAKFRDYQYTDAAQRIWAKAGFRPVDPKVAADFSKEFPAPQKLWTIADLGGWKKVDKDLFAKEGGAISAIFESAGK